MVLGGTGEPEAVRPMMVLPDDLERHGVKLDHPGQQSNVSGHPEIPVACPSTVVKEQDVAFPREALGDQMRMVRADELTKAATSHGVR